MVGGSYFILGLEDQGEQWLGAPLWAETLGQSLAWVELGAGLFCCDRKGTQSPQ